MNMCSGKQVREAFIGVGDISFTDIEQKKKITKYDKSPGLWVSPFVDKGWNYNHGLFWISNKKVWHSLPTRLRNRKKVAVWEGNMKKRFAKKKGKKWWELRLLSYKEDSLEGNSVQLGETCE